MRERRPKPLAWLAAALLGVFVLLALFGPALAPYDPVATNPAVALKAPTTLHPFGTDALGRDIFSRVIAAARVDLGVALTAVALTLALGAALGAAAGWAGGWTERIVGRLLDTIMAFPLFVLAVGVAAALGNSVSSVVIATIVVNLPLYARLTRADVSRRRNAGYVEAARLAGVGAPAIVAFHIMPNVLPPLMAPAALNMGWAMLNAAGLSFLGLGIRPPQPEWGIMVSEGAANIFTGEWWLFLFPGAALALAVLAFSLIGDALRERLDPETSVSPLLSIRDLSIRFGAPGRPATVEAVDLDIARGEIVALVGESGSGKSLLAHAIAGILTPAAQLQAERLTFGGVDLRRPDSAGWADIRGREIGVVFQNPRAALNPIRCVGAQIGDVVSRHQLLRGRELARAVASLLEAVRIPDPERRARALPGALSGGMCQRVMLAIALAGNPALLIADEPTTGLDNTTQAAILDLVLDHAERRRMATLFITHDLGLARSYAHRIVVMHAGQIAETATTAALFAAPRHPYSSALIAAAPADVENLDALKGIAGAPPSLDGAVPACRYAPRCDRGLADCLTQRPLLRRYGEGHAAACWNPQ